MDIRGTDFIYYQTNDIEKAIEFYRDTLGLEMYGYFEEVKWAEFNAGNAAFAVDNLEEYVNQLEAKGVTVTIPTNETPVCHFACIKDPDGNTIWLHNRKDGTFGH